MTSSVIHSASPSVSMLLLAAAVLPVLGAVSVPFVDVDLGSPDEIGIEMVGL